MIFWNKAEAMIREKWFSETDLNPWYLGNDFQIWIWINDMQITFSPDRGSNPVHWTQSPTLYCVASKGQLVPQGSTRVLYIYTQWHSPPQIEIHP